jgi:lysophospholipase L1-like esterase
LLIVGDSTAVGTGASQPAESVAGRIGRAFPQVAIVNRGRDGAKTAAVSRQLGNPRDASFDAILIQVGGNDILRFTGVSRLREDLQALLGSAKAQAGLVVMMSTGDVGRAPAFPWPVDKYYSWKSKRVRQMILSLVAAEGVEYIDLYNPRPDNPFYRDPKRFYAHDGLHPSGQGYGLWYDKLIAESSLSRVLADAP